MPTIIFPATNASLVFGGSYTDGGTFGRPSRNVSPGMRIDFVAHGTDLTLVNSAYGSGYFSIVVDGGAAVVPTYTSNWGSFASLPIFTGLTDADHVVTIRTTNQNVYLDVNNFLSLTGSAPALTLRPGYTNIQANTLAPAIQSDGSLLSNSAAGTTFYGPRGAFRFKATTTGFAIWCLQDGVSFRMLVDDDPAMGTVYTTPNTGVFDWFPIAGLDRTAEHQYTIMWTVSVPSLYVYGIMITDALGSLNTAALAARPLLAIYGDSISVGYTIADYGLCFAERFATARKMAYLNVSSSGRTVHAYASGTPPQTTDSGESHTSLVTANTPVFKAVVVELGVNDSLQTFGPQTPAQFQTSYTNMLQAIINGLPAATPIYALNYLDTSVAPGVTNRSSFIAAQAAAVAACTSNTAVTVIPTSGWITPASDTSDGLHPNAGGHAKITTQLLASAGVANAYTLGLSAASGLVGAAVNATVTPLAGSYTGTLSVAVSGGGLATTLTYGFSGSSAAQTQSVTPTSLGTVTFTPTASPALGTNPTVASYTSNPLPLALGAFTLSSSSPAGPVLAYVGTSGGSGIVTTRLHRSTTEGFTPSGSTAGTGTCLAVSPAFLYTDGTAVAGTLYYYRVQATDSAVTPVVVTSTQVAGSVYSTAIRLACFGDSTTTYQGLSPAAILPGLPPFVTALRNIRSGRTITVSNQGQPGTFALNWSQTAGGTPYYQAAHGWTIGGGTAVPGFLADFGGGGPTHATIMIGANDALNQFSSGVGSASFYTTYLTTMIANLQADYPGIILFVAYPTYVAPTSANNILTNTILVSYHAVIDAVDNRNGANTVRAIGQSVYGKLAENYSRYGLPTNTALDSDHTTKFYTRADGIHATAAGEDMLGAIWARDIDAFFNPQPTNGLRFSRSMNGGYAS